ncbi:MAG: putative selenium-dependent hydroxylase accessory protein YqeC, partial [Caldilineaceae bacterium]|nr:putative selenium-dependent hydroxylase accessory protein YqeC [Caldilineaceae bacterium]
MRPVKAPAAHEPVLPASTTLLAPVVGLDAAGRPIDARTVHRPELVRAVLGLAGDAPANLTPAMLARLLCDPAGGAKGLQPAMRLLPLLNKADSPLHLAFGRLTAALLARAGQPALLTSVGADNPVPVAERWGPVAVIVLAAGGSRRMGRPKQLEVVDGEAMVVRAARTALASNAGPVMVVTGAEADAVAALLGARMPAVDVIHNPRWASGQATSMQAALQALPASVEAAILMPVDQPYLDGLLLRRLVQAWRAGADLATPAIDGTLRGAPALFDRRFWPELMAVTGDVGGRPVLAAHRDTCVAVPANPAWLRDIDTPDDL